MAYSLDQIYKDGYNSLMFGGSLPSLVRNTTSPAISAIPSQPIKNQNRQVEIGGPTRPPVSLSSPQVTNTPPITPTQQNWSLEDLSGLFNRQLESWWNTVKPTLSQTTTQPQTSSISDQGLSSLFPRVNWGNYQTANRGNRYFDQNTGNYSLDNTITMGT